MPDGSELINVARYPLDQDGPERTRLVSQVRADLDRDGCAVLRGFLTAAGVAAIRAETDAVADRGHRSYSRTNAYFTAPDPSLPPDDPRSRFFDRSNSFISADNFGHGGALRAAHDFEGFDPFIRECLQQQLFYRYADPLADVIVNMAEAGPGFPWHFDTNAFTVTLAIQNADQGGAFEYAANIRSADDENLDGVRDVLDGASDGVVSLDLQPGDLQLFKGRYSLHRVAPLAGPTPRYVAIFSYVDQPDMVGTPERARQLYGKALPIHYERAGLRADTLLD